ncbi:hypothetical protein [Microbulbifer hydrolyticus]|uniref:Uncharacterized protein n=1 Tax=Microbulbifer hydrolyticus TaxID=48074 RepID=A0A6P1TBN8_9GAMM|nr:hypothetical protein [Microbulbifer hydrolyticus]MBB5213110.1 hypothetical protein [Microbulbifer hydrolyticus]QHQ38679.1 hypothetical protein GTQ55_06535 [Microbulbifer hydrolyticus]
MNQRDFKRNEELHSKTRDSIAALEDKIAQVLLESSGSEYGYSVAVYYFFGVLAALFRFLDRESKFKRSAIDDFELETVSETTKKIHLEGRCYWLGGGRSYDTFKIDYAKNTDPKLYSFKFRANDPCASETLYVGKTYTGWEIGDA